MTYKLGKIEFKTTGTGKKYATCNMQDTTGEIYDRVSIWEDNPNFPNLVEGGEVTGEVKTNENGYKSLYTARASTSSSPRGNMSGMMKEKQEGIAVAQERKSDSILISATARDASMILVELMKKDDAIRANWEQEWLNIRHWLVKNFGNTEIKKVGNTGVDYPTDTAGVNSIPF